MNIINKRSLAYETIYGSDIFNLLPEKKPINTHINLHRNGSSSTQMKNALSCSNIFRTNNNKENKNKERESPYNKENNYSRYLSEFYNIKINKNQEKIRKNTKGILKQELNDAQPFKYSKQTNRIESLKSNIFNDKEKEKQNYIYNKNYTPIIHNNWNTNLDWKNSKTELILSKSKNNNQKIECNDINDYYQHKNIIVHKYKINNTKDVDINQFVKNMSQKGIHIFNVEYSSDFLKDTSEQSVTFNVRDNTQNAFNKELIKVNEGNIIDNIKKTKVDINPKKYYSKIQVNKNNNLMNDYLKKGTIKE